MMKKKLYIQPDMVVVNMNMHQMLCSSIQSEGNNLSVTLDDAEDFGSGETINSRSFDFWGNED